MLGGVDGGPWAVGGGLEVRLFFLGLFGESGEPPVPGLKSAAKVLLFVTPENKVNFSMDLLTDKACKILQGTTEVNVLLCVLDNISVL